MTYDVRSMTAVTFTVPGRPAPQGSKSFKGFRNGRGVMVESSKEVGAWRERVALAAHNAMGGRDLFDGAVNAYLEFTMPRPKSTPKTYTPPAAKRPDVDKLARACLDAISGVIICDDSQIIELRASKRIAEIGETPGVAVTVEPVAGADQ